ncbi:MAG: ATPase domain-containing protein [Candidatus Woesearchaeota archaeon]
MTNSEPERIRVGVPGFDDLIEKGLPKGINILISGGPGTGKTTFCLQALAYGAKNGEKCLYMSFEESRERLLQHMRDYGFDPDSLLEKNLLMIKCIDPFQISRSVEALLASARGELLIDINEVAPMLPVDFKPDRIIFDSLSAVAAAFAEKEEGFRVYIEQLFRELGKVGATSFLISEVEQGLTRYSKSGVEEFLADAVIAFYNLRRENLRLNALEIIKIRGAAHQKKVVPFSMLSGKGIEVYPLENIFTTDKD